MLPRIAAVGTCTPSCQPALRSQCSDEVPPFWVPMTRKDGRQRVIRRWRWWSSEPGLARTRCVSIERWRRPIRLSTCQRWGGRTGGWRGGGGRMATTPPTTTRANPGEHLVVAEGVRLQESRVALAHALVVPRAVLGVTPAHLAASVPAAAGKRKAMGRTPTTTTTTATTIHPAGGERTA